MVRIYIATMCDIQLLYTFTKHVYLRSTNKAEFMTNTTFQRSPESRNDFAGTSYYTTRGYNVQKIFPYVLSEFPGFYFSLSLCRSPTLQFDTAISRLFINSRNNRSCIVFIRRPLLSSRGYLITSFGSYNFKINDDGCT